MQAAKVTRVKISGTSHLSDFGAAVAISGNTAVIGAYETNSASVYTERAGKWRLQAALSPSPAAQFFGWGVAISGSTIAVGAAGFSGPGVVFIFNRTGTKWAQTTEFQASDAASADQFGAALSFSGGNLLVGAPESNKAYVFTQESGQWVQTAELTAADGAPNDRFGHSVALSGGTALIGAPSRQGSIGAAYVFTESGGTWAQQAELTGDYPGVAEFGNSVALAGSTALIGAPYQNGLVGAAYVFTRSGSTWTQRAELPGPIPSEVLFGFSVALEPGTAVIDNNAAPDGDAYVFKGSGPSWALADTATGPVGGKDGWFGPVSVSGTTTIVGVPSLGGWDGGAYLFSPV